MEAVLVKLVLSIRQNKIANLNYVYFQKPESTEAESLDYNHLEGVFIVLTYGSFFALIYGIITTVWSIHNRAREAKAIEKNIN